MNWIASFLAAALAASILGGCAEQPARRAPAGSAPAGLEVGMSVDIGADGRVTAVSPDPGVPAELRARLIERVSGWRFRPARWQGRAVSTRRRLDLRLEALDPNAGGGAWRVLGQGHAPDPDPATRVVPPQYPPELLARGVGGTLVYAARLDVEGALGDIRRLQPAGPLDAAMQQLDAAARAALSRWRMRPAIADGQAVSCDAVVPMQFLPPGATPPAPDTERLEPRLAPCPVARLETGIAGTTL